MISFNIFNPYSIFKRIFIFSSVFASLISFHFNIKEELGEEAIKNTMLGAQIRELYQ
jgi:hypothetical protein